MTYNNPSHSGFAFLIGILSSVRTEGEPDTGNICSDFLAPVSSWSPFLLLLPAHRIGLLVKRLA